MSHPARENFADRARVRPSPYTAESFVTAAVAYYSEKYTRRVCRMREMARAVHAHILSDRTLEFASGKITPAGAVCSARAPNDFQTICAITEVKNEIGDGHSDPLAEAECAYVAIYSSTEVCDSQCSSLRRLRLHC